MSDVKINFSANTSRVIKSLQEIRAAGGRTGKAMGSSFAQGSSAASRAVAKLRAEVEAAGRRMQGMNLAEMFMGADAFASLAMRARQMFTGLMKPAMEMEQLAVGFETLLGSADAAERHLANLSKYAAETPFDISGVATASKTLLGFGVEADKSMDVLRRLGDVAAVTGSSVEDLARVYGKVASVGKLDTVAIDMLSERGLNMRELLARRDGISVAQVQKNIQNRRYGLADLDYALQQETGEGGKFFEGAIRQSKTLAGQVAILEDQLYQLRVQLGEEMADGMRAAVQYITEELPRIYEELRPTVVMSAEGLKQIAAHLPEILASLRRIGAGLAIFASLKMAVAGVNALRGAWRVAGAAVAVCTGNVNKLGRGISRATLAARGLGVAMRGLAKAGLGPIGWALTAAEVGMFAWDSLKGYFSSSAAGEPSSAPAPRDYSGMSFEQLGREMWYQRMRQDIARNETNSPMIGGRTSTEQLQNRLNIVREAEQELARLGDAFGQAMAQAVADAKGQAAQQHKLYMESLRGEIAELQRVNAARRELLQKHHTDMDAVEDRAWQGLLAQGNMSGLLAALRSSAADVGLPSGWRTAREGVAAMERARHSAAMDGDTVRYTHADDTLKSLRQLAEREEKAADTRRQARYALARANLTLAGETRTLERMEDRQRAVELATQYREAGLPAAEADRRAAQLVATERAAANKPAAGGVEIIAQNKVAVGGGGVSLRLNDAQLDLSRKSVVLQEQQATLLQEIRNVFRSRSNTDLIPVMP